MNEAEKQDMFDLMANTDGPLMEFYVERSMETVDRDGLGRTISQEALEALDFQMITWVGTRIMRSGAEKGVMPQGVKVTVTVEFP